MEIKPYLKNAKKHSKKQIEAIARSINEFGFHQPIVVDKKGVIIVGHGRYAAAKLLEMKDEDIPVIVADLTAKQAAAYRLADNKLNESSWDMDLVLEELQGLSVKMVDVAGFNLEKVENDVKKVLAKKENKSTSESKMVHTCPSCGVEFDKDGVISKAAE